MLTLRLRGSLLWLWTLSLVITFAGCSKKEKEVEPLVAVQVAKAQPTTLVETINADAVLFAVRQAAITPKFNAPVRKFYVQRGDKVKEGQLLATLENRDLAASMTESRGGYEQAQAGYTTATKAGIPEEVQKAELDVQQAKQNLDAQTKLVESRKSLFDQGALPRKDYDAAQVSYIQAKGQYEIAAKHLASVQGVNRQQETKSAEAQLMQARGKFEGAQAQYGYSEIRSPIAGVVTDRPNYIGEVPAAGAPLITVMDTSSVIAKAHISQQYAAQLKLGDAAQIEATGVEAPVPGKVTQISPALDPNSTTVEIWVTAKNPEGQLRPGSSAKISIETHRAANALAVPQSAVIEAEDGKQTVAVVNDGVAQLRPVETGIHDAKAGLVQITSGLKPGEVVVTTAAYGLPDKTKVKIQSAPASQPENSSTNGKGDKGE
jgi:HlyD family secretion protein